MNQYQYVKPTHDSLYPLHFWLVTLYLNFSIYFQDVSTILNNETIYMHTAMSLSTFKLWIDIST